MYSILRVFDGPTAHKVPTEGLQVSQVIGRGLTCVRGPKWPRRARKWGFKVEQSDQPNFWFCVYHTLSLYRYVCDMMLICMLFIYLTMHIVCILFTLLLINFTLLIFKLLLCIELYIFKPNYIISVTVVHFIISLHILLFIWLKLL